MPEVAHSRLPVEVRAQGRDQQLHKGQDPRQPPGNATPHRARPRPPPEALEDERLAELENNQWVADVLSDLSPGQRDVMQLLADGLSREEIAQALGKSAEVVRRHLCDARARLAELLNPDGEYRSETARSSREEAP